MTRRPTHAVWGAAPRDPDAALRQPLDGVQREREESVRSAFRARRWGLRLLRMRRPSASDPNARAAPWRCRCVVLALACGALFAGTGCARLHPVRAELLARDAPVAPRCRPEARALRATETELHAELARVGRELALLADAGDLPAYRALSERRLALLIAARALDRDLVSACAIAPEGVGPAARDPSGGEDRPTRSEDERDAEKRALPDLTRRIAQADEALRRARSLSETREQGDAWGRDGDSRLEGDGTIPDVFGEHSKPDAQRPHVVTALDPLILEKPSEPAKPAGDTPKGVPDDEPTGGAHIAQARVRSQPTPMDVAPLIRATLPTLFGCLSEAARREALRLDVTLRVDAQGALRDARVTSIADGFDARAGDCMSGVLERLKLADYSGEGGVVSFPLEYQP